MILGFRDQFEPYVLDGTKRHTIRSGERWRPGMRADLFVKVRQKGMRLLFRVPVVRVESIHIFCDLKTRPDGWPNADVAPLHCKTDIAVEGETLDKSELELFAWRDGFRWRTKPCAHCCNWSACDSLKRCRNATSDAYKGSSFQQMVEFWRKEHGFGTKIREFRGQLIHWDYEGRFIEKARTA